MEHDQIAARLGLALEREAARHRPSPDGWSQIERRHRRRAWRRAGIAALCVAVVAAAATAAPYLWRAGSGPPASHPHPRPAPKLILAGRTHLNRGVTKLAAGYGSVWVIGAGAIYRVDPATAAIVATIPVPGTGQKLSGIATGAGAVWVTSEAPHYGVYRIDPRHGRVTSFIRLQPTPTGIAVAYHWVWVIESKPGPGIVIRIDPRANHVSGPPIRIGISPGRIVPGAGALWLTSGSSNSWMSRINPATGVVTRVLANVENVDAVGAGSLWVTPIHGGIQRVDPATGRVIATIRLRNAVRVTFWAGSVWASTEPPGALVRIDPASGRIVGKAVPAGTSPIYIAAGPSGLWVADFGIGDLLHFALPTTAK
jgi:streptogramin lyase